MKNHKKVFCTGPIILSVLIASLITACGDESYDPTGVYDEQYSEPEYYSMEYGDPESDEYYEDSYSSDMQDSDNTGGSDYALDNSDFPLGSADFPDGNTVVVSIIGNDAGTSWDESSESDSAKLYDSLDYLGIACNYLEAQSQKWGCDAKFIYDWSANSDLAYDADFSTDMVEDSYSTDLEIADYIAENIPSDELMQEYDAPNIIYMVLINTPDSNDVTSFTSSWYEGVGYPYEVCRMFTSCDGEEEPPAAYAHEMLHTFGAPDLYSVPDPEYGITEEFFSYIEENDYNDLMYTVYNAESDEAEYDGISNELTDIDAYYIGWTDSSETVYEWGLEPSQHQ